MQTKGPLGLSSSCYGCEDKEKLLEFREEEKSLERDREEISKLSQNLNYVLNSTTF